MMGRGGGKDNLEWVGMGEVVGKTTVFITVPNK